MELEYQEMLPGMYPYINGLTTGPETGVRAEMEQYGRRRRFPIVGRLVGRFLLQLAIISRARRILEIGSGFGYSATWFLEAGPDVRVICTDDSALNRSRALEYFGRLGVADRVDFRLGDALRLAESAEGEFDLIFCDMDKRGYPAAFLACLPKLRRGGLFVADNVLWRGFAWSELPKDAPDFRKQMTPGVREFNSLTHNCAGVVTTIIPLRDGVSVSVKI